MNRVIITGPTGAIGMALIEYLSKRNIQVIAVVRGDSKRKNQIKESENIAKLECSLADMAQLPELVKAEIKRKKWDEHLPIDVFYHFAWDGTFGNSRNDTYLQNRNVKYTLDAVTAASELGCSVFVGAGSQAEYGRFEGSLNADVPTFPENGYGIAKLCAGQLSRLECNEQGIRHIWVRILSVYGPFDGEKTMVMTTVRKLLNGEVPALTMGEQKWDYLYSADAAKALYLLGEKGKNNKVYCIGSGQARPLAEYIRIMRDAIDTKAELGLGQVPYGEKQVMYLCADIGELKKDTGFEPEVSFEEGISRIIAWMKTREKE